MTQQVKMPEPVATVRRTPTAITYKQKSSLGVRLGKNDLITTDQAEAYAAAKVREALGWQPIETAPQGCIALFYNANATEVRNCAFVDWTVDGKFCGNRHHTATHWMSLPPPPQHDN